MFMQIYNLTSRLILSSQTANGSYVMPSSGVYIHVCQRTQTTQGGSDPLTPREFIDIEKNLPYPNYYPR